MTRTALIGYLWLLISNVAYGQGFDGLYFPKDDSEPWNCKAEDIGQYGGALGIKGRTLYATENTCVLSSPRKTVGGTEFIGSCVGEGDEYREVFTLNRTLDGISIGSGSQTTQWKRCPNKLNNPKIKVQSNGIPPKSKWVVGFAMGVSERTISNSKGESVIFSCDKGSDEEQPSIDFETKRRITGMVSIEIDGRPRSFVANDNGISFKPNCPLCLSDYVRLMKALFVGNTMTIIRGSTTLSQFEISGANEAFEAYICTQSE